MGSAFLDRKRDGPCLATVRCLCSGQAPTPKHLSRSGVNIGSTHESAPPSNAMPDHNVPDATRRHGQAVSRSSLLGYPPTTVCGARCASVKTALKVQHLDFAPVGKRACPRVSMVMLQASFLVGGLSPVSYPMIPWGGVSETVQTLTCVRACWLACFIANLCRYVALSMMNRMHCV